MATKTADADSPQETADADSAQESEATPRDSAARFDGSGNRLPEVVMAGLILVFLVGSIVASSLKGEKTPPGDPGVRALILPTADRARTVVVPPCGTGTAVTARNAAAQVDTPGSTVVRLPPAQFSRVLLIARCSASTAEGGAETVAQVPSSVFVLATGSKTAIGVEGVAAQTKKGKKEKAKKKPKPGPVALEPRSQLIVPSASQGQLVVVPACSGSGRSDRATVLSPTAANPAVLLAPRC